MLIRPTLATVVLLAPFLAQPGQRRTVDLEAADCSHYQSTWSDMQTAYGTQRAAVPSTAGTLELKPQENGGVQVVHGTGNAYSITACIAAAAPSMADAQKIVEGVRIVVDGNRVTTSGGENGRRTNVQLVVEAPRDARIKATTLNGPISFEDVAGTFTAHGL